MLTFVYIVIGLCTCVCEGLIRDTRVRLSIESPHAYAIVQGGALNLQVSIEMIEGGLTADMNALLCVNTDFTVPFQLESPQKIDRNNDQCSNSNKFQLAGLESGSHHITVYLKAFEGAGQYAIASTYGLYSIVNSAIPGNSTAEVDAGLSDTLTMFKTVAQPSLSKHITVRLTKRIGLDDDVYKAKRRRRRPIGSGCTKVVFFVKELQHHGANNRLFHWLFDNDRFVDNNFCLSVVTSSHAASRDPALEWKLSQQARVDIQHFDCLSHTVDTMATLEEYFDAVEGGRPSRGSGSPVIASLLALSAFLHTAEVVVAVNTLGDPQTSTLLYALKDRLNPATPSTASSPLLLLDLPNIQIPEGWSVLRSTLGGFLAPSRFAGWHPDIVSFERPVAVVYPPAVSEDWLQQSTCQRPTTNWSESGSAELDATGSMAPTSSTRRFLVVGRLDVDKCPCLLLLAVQRLVQNLSGEEQRHVSVDFYGDGPLRESLARMVVDLGLERVVRLHGAVGERELRAAMGGATALVNPKLRGETFGFVHGEAASMGLPVVAYRAGANEETVAEGLLVDAEGDVVEALALGMQAVGWGSVGAASSVEERCKAARSRLAQWSVKRHSESLMDVIRNLL